MAGSTVVFMNVYEDLNTNLALLDEILRTSSPAPRGNDSCRVELERRVAADRHCLEEYLITDRPSTPDLPRLRKMIGRALTAVESMPARKSEARLSDEQLSQATAAASALRRAASAPHFLWEDSESVSCPV